MALHTYDPKEVFITFGPVIITGYADGSFLNIEPTEDAFTLQMGTDGDGTRSKSNNRSGFAEVTLMQSSEANLLLSAIHNLDLASGDGIEPLFVKDNSGESLYTAEKAWIRRFPASEFAREATSRVWTFDTDRLIQLVGGN